MNKPCPFCGCDETPVIVVNDNALHNTATARAHCAECDASGPPVTTEYFKPGVLFIKDVDDLERVALDAWSRRMVEPA